MRLRHSHDAREDQSDAATEALAPVAALAWFAKNAYSFVSVGRYRSVLISAATRAPAAL